MVSISLGTRFSSIGCLTWFVYIIRVEFGSQPRHDYYFNEEYDRVEKRLSAKKGVSDILATSRCR